MLRKGRIRVNLKKYVLAVLAVFFAHSAAGYLIHDILLGESYARLAFVRAFDEFAGRLPLLYLANLIFAVVLCFIYTRAYDRDEAWYLQGLMFGGLMAAFLVPAALVAYVALPLPGGLALKVTALTSVHVILSGMTGAAIYRK